MYIFVHASVLSGTQQACFTCFQAAIHFMSLLLRLCSVHPHDYGRQLPAATGANVKTGATGTAVKHTRTYAAVHPIAMCLHEDENVHAGPQLVVQLAVN